MKYNFNNLKLEIRKIKNRLEQKRLETLTKNVNIGKRLEKY